MSINSGYILIHLDDTFQCLSFTIRLFHCNTPGKADVTLTIGDNDLVDLMLGKLNPQKAFFQGKLKIQVLKNQHQKVQSHVIETPMTIINSIYHQQ